jgi:hypothetical protein
MVLFIPGSESLSVISRPARCRRRHGTRARERPAGSVAEAKAGAESVLERRTDDRPIACAAKPLKMTLFDVFRVFCALLSAIGSDVT